MHAGGNLPIRIFGGDNDPVNQHAGDQYQREQYDNIHRHTDCVQHRNADKK